jgi:hypothetical protein
MALPQPDTPYRQEVRLNGPECLDEDLGLFGRWVGPRFDALRGSRQRERNRLGEDWCLRQLLIAMSASKRLTYPVVLRTTEAGFASRQHIPDAVLECSDGRLVGIEVTQATSPDWQRHLNEVDRRHAAASGDVAVLDPGDGYAGDGPEKQAVQEIQAARANKLERLGEGGYSGVREVDLLVYLNSQASIHVSPAEVVQRLREATAPRDSASEFRQVHLLFDDAVALDVLGATHEVCHLGGRYEHDFRQWCTDQAERLRTGDVAGLDLRNLAEELRSLGGSDERGRDSQIRRLLQHLLKWQYQPEKRSTSWAVSIANARIEIEELVDYSPSLGRTDELRKAVEKEYPRAVRLASRETGLKRSAFPGHCPYALNQIFDPDYPDDLVNED